MVDASRIQDKIANKLFTTKNIHETILYNRYQLVANSYGEEELTFQNQATFKGIVKDYISVASKYDNAGRYDDSELVIIAPYDTNIKSTDVVEYKSTDYIIQNISEPTLGGCIMCKIIFLKQDN